MLCELQQIELQLDKAHRLEIHVTTESQIQDTNHTKYVCRTTLIVTHMYCHVLECDTIDGVLDWRLDLLITLPHDSVTTSNYGAIADLHTLQITLCLFSLLCLHQSFPGNGFNSGDSSASALTSLPAGSQLHQLSFLFTDSLTTDLQLNLSHW
jgi:hypothetical protein